MNNQFTHSLYKDCKLTTVNVLLPSCTSSYLMIRTVSLKFELSLIPDLIRLKENSTVVHIKGGLCQIINVLFKSDPILFCSLRASQRKPNVRMPQSIVVPEDKISFKYNSLFILGYLLLIRMSNWELLPK